MGKEMENLILRAGGTPRVPRRSADTGSQASLTGEVLVHRELVHLGRSGVDTNGRQRRSDALL